MTGEFYIGGSTDVTERFKDHKSMLKSGTHRNPNLQSAWDEYEADDFEYTILQELDDNLSWDDIKEVENNYIQKLKPAYNVVYRGMEGKPVSAETKQKISDTMYRNNGRQPLTKEEIACIKWEAETAIYSHKKIGEEYNVSATTVHNILHGIKSCACDDEHICGLHLGLDWGKEDD